MSQGPAERMDLDDRPPTDRDHDPSPSESAAEPESPTDLMVVSRSRRSNAGNRMSTLLAKSAEEEEWGEEWEETANEQEFVGDDANDQDDFNMDSSSSEEDDGAAEEDEGERELRKAERQERIKKRKTAANPFAARLAASSRKRVKLNVPATRSPTSATARPKKKSERASWIPTDEDGPIRTSSRRQTIANKENTLAKLKEKDKRRDDTLAMMKAAEARKAKDEPKPLTQAERLAEAARVEKRNSKSLHRWEELEEQRAAERQAKLDALKNRQIEGPFIRYYSGPAIWVDDKLRYTGKDAPKLEQLEEKLNKEALAATSQGPQSGDTDQVVPDNTQQPFGNIDQFQTSQSSLMISTSQSQLLPAIPSVSEPAQGPTQEGSAAPQNVTYPSSIVFAPPQQPDPFLFEMDHFAHPDPPSEHHTSQEYARIPTAQPELPPNPFLHTSQSLFPQSQPSPSNPLVAQDGTIAANLLSQFQGPPALVAPPMPPRRRTIRRALRNLLVMSSFPNLDAPPTSTRVRTAASLLKEKDRAALIQLSTALFGWSQPDASSFVTAMLNAPKTKKEKEALAKSKKELCAVSNKEARYRDPETGIAYRDSRAFGVLRGVVGGGFVWCGELACYVGGRAKPMEGMGKGFLGMAPAAGVPKRFLEMARKTPQPELVAKPHLPEASADAPPTPVAPPADGAAVQDVETQGVVS